MSLTYIQIGYVLLTVICLLAVFRGLHITLLRTEPNIKIRKSIFNKALMVLAGWIGIVTLISASGFIQDFNAIPPRLLIFLWPPLIGLIWLLRQQRTSRLLQATPPQWLMYIQAFRIPVELFLWWQFLLGLTPVQMTLEGQNFDILVGISGPLMGLLMLCKSRWNITAGLVWNILSLAMLLNIVIVAILSFPSPMRLFMNEPANTLISSFPIVFLPLVLVPLAYYMHAFSIKQLLMLQQQITIHSSRLGKIKS